MHWQLNDLLIPTRVRRATEPYTPVVGSQRVLARLCGTAFVRKRAAFASKRAELALQGFFTQRLSVPQHGLAILSW